MSELPHDTNPYASPATTPIADTLPFHKIDTGLLTAIGAFSLVNGIIGTVIGAVGPPPLVPSFLILLFQIAIVACLRARVYAEYQINEQAAAVSWSVLLALFLCATASFFCCYSVALMEQPIRIDSEFKVGFFVCAVTLIGCVLQIAFHYFILRAYYQANIGNQNA